VYLENKNYKDDDASYILKFIRWLVQCKKEIIENLSCKHEYELVFKKKFFESMWFYIIPESFKEGLLEEELERLKGNLFQEANETFHSRIGYDGGSDIISTYLLDFQKHSDLIKISGNKNRLQIDMQVNSSLIFFIFLC
jgi:hypothetical protein